MKSAAAGCGAGGGGGAGEAGDGSGGGGGGGGAAPRAALLHQLKALCPAGPGKKLRVDGGCGASSCGGGDDGDARSAGCGSRWGSGASATGSRRGEMAEAAHGALAANPRLREVHSARSVHSLVARCAAAGAAGGEEACA